MGHGEQQGSEFGASAMRNDGGDAIGAAAEFLITQSGAVEKIRAVHVPDPDGRGCVVCGRGQHGSHTWPCALAAIAQRATALRVAHNIPVTGR